MVQKKGKRTLIAALAVLVALLLVIGAVALIKVASQNKADPYAKQTTTSEDEPSNDSAPKDSDQGVEPENPDKANDATSSQPALDPSTVSTIDIAPMGITVSYVKGVGRFEYQVLRTTNGTRYVEFSSSDLVGTKCTNDIGTFASILASPEENDSTTLAKTTNVDGTTYGISLESSTCTANAEKLQAYQKSFSDAFGLLKKMN